MAYRGPRAVTLPRRLWPHHPARRQRLRKWALGALIALGAALLAAAFWLPVKAELAQQLLHRAWSETAANSGTAAVHPWPWADTWPVARLTLPGRREPLTVCSRAPPAARSRSRRRSGTAVLRRECLASA